MAYLLAGIFFFAAGEAVFAQEAADVEASAVSGNETDAIGGFDAAGGWVTDDAELLTREEAAELERMCAEVSQSYNVGVSVVTTENFGGGDIKDWQRKIFAERGLGLGENDSGVMLAVSMSERDWGIVAFGDAISAFTTYGREQMGERIVPKLSDGEYYEAFSEYVRLADKFLLAASEGEPYSEENKYREPVSKVLIVFVSFVLSFVVSLLVVLYWKKGMDTRVRQNAAGAYLREGSFRLTRSSDRFLYHTVSRHARPKSDSGSGSMSSDSSGTSGKF